MSTSSVNTRRSAPSGASSQPATSRPTAGPAAQNPIVPPRSVARRALLALVAIMAFLAALSVEAVFLVAEQARDWTSQIAAEVTIQVLPTAGVDTQTTVARAAEIALQTPGVSTVRTLSDDEGAALLEPWLGSGFDRTELPIPRLIAVHVERDADIAALSRRLGTETAGASLDDHGLWLRRLSSMAGVTILIGIGVLVLILSATALSVVFATRGAMAGNRDVIEVLHFVGAEDRFVAREFQRHFLLLGLKGAGIGGLAALGLIGLVSFAPQLDGSSPEAAQVRSLLGDLDIGAAGIVAVAATAILIAAIIAVTARVTVRQTLLSLDRP